MKLVAVIILVLVPSFCFADQLPTCSSGLSYAVAFNDYDSAQTLLEAGANPACMADPVDGDGLTPLQWVSFPKIAEAYYANDEERIKMAELLFKYGGEVTVNSHADGADTSICLAAQSSGGAYVQFLLDHQADATTLCYDDWAAFDYSVSSDNDISAMNTLAKAGIDINRQTTYWNDTPLIKAVKNYKHPEKAQRLIELKANLEIAAKGGRTALIVASEIEAPYRTQFLTMLLKAGANVGAKDLDGKTALDHARAAGDSDAVTVLNKYGAH